MHEHREARQTEVTSKRECTTMEHEITIWAYEAPDKHQHKPSGWSLVDDEVNGEMVLRCSRCERCWHTGVPADDDYHDTDDLKAAAAKWLVLDWFGLARRQLVLPLVVPFVERAPLTKRRYTPAVRVDLSAQMSLFAAAA
jgi:hypothetical protein